jgi:hypothetical protein
LQSKLIQGIFVMMARLPRQPLFRTGGADLSAIAANSHFAPAAATVLGGFEQQPTALHASASLGARQLFSMSRVSAET